MALGYRAASDTDLIAISGSLGGDYLRYDSTGLVDILTVGSYNSPKVEVELEEVGLGT